MSLPLDPGARRARAAVSLGAAVAIFGSVFLGYDAPESQAASGFFETLFGAGRAPETAYDGYAPRRYYRFSRAPRRFRLAHRLRRHDVQARRRVVERRPSPERRQAVAAGEQKRPMGPALIEIIAPARNPFLPVTLATGAAPSPARAARLAAPEPQKTSGGCGGSCVTEVRAAPVARLASAPATEFYADPTLRPGDTVVTAEGVRILRPGSRFPFKATDFVSLAEAGKTYVSHRGALNEIERALRTPMGRAPADL